MIKDKNNVSSNSSDAATRRVKPAIVERIRNRASNSGSGDGNGGNSSGSSSGSGDGSNPASGLATPNIDNVVGTEIGSDAVTDGLRVTDPTTTRGNKSRTGTGSIGDSSTARPTNGSTETPAVEKVTILKAQPSLLSVTDVIDDGLVIRDGKKKTGPGRPATKKKNGLVDNTLLLPLKIACGFVFSIPVYFGWGKHWDLSDDETDELATNLREVLNQFPSQTTVDFLKALDKYLPVITLGMSLYTMISLRYQHTRLLLREKKEREIQAGNAGQVINYDENQSGQEIPVKKLVM